MSHVLYSNKQITQKQHILLFGSVDIFLVQKQQIDFLCILFYPILQTIDIADVVQQK